jgi:hypothetical protein
VKPKKCRGGIRKPESPVHMPCSWLHGFLLNHALPGGGRSYCGTSTLCREQILRFGRLGLHITHCYLQECSLIESNGIFVCGIIKYIGQLGEGGASSTLSSRIIIFAEWW